MVSFKDHTVLVGRKTLFRTRLQFEFFALLAVAKVTLPADQAWVSLEQIARLPGWKGKQKHHVSTNVGRYMQSVDAKQFVEARTRWGGPYRLSANALSVDFDVPMRIARKYLGLHPKKTVRLAREAVLEFARAYARALSQFFKGKLVRHREQITTGDDSAYSELLQLIGCDEYGASFRLLATISAADVLYRLGRFRVARETLEASRTLVRQTPDLSLKAVSPLTGLAIPALVDWHSLRPGC